MSVDFALPVNDPAPPQGPGPVIGGTSSNAPGTLQAPDRLGEVLRDLRHMRAHAAPDLADWLVYLDLQGKAVKTLYVYNRQIAPLLRANPDVPFERFTDTHVNGQLRLVPPRSRHITRSIYNGWFEWGVTMGRLERSPMGRVPKMRQPKRRPSNIFSEPETALLEALPVPDGPLWVILFGSGIRRSEARHLRLCHIDVARARLLVYNGKGDKDRVIPVEIGVLQAVADLELLEGMSRQDYLWYSRLGRGPQQRRLRRDPIATTTFERWYARCITAAGVRYLNPHQTRHTYGQTITDKGFDLEERQLLMGHDNPNTTRRYYPGKTIENVARKMAQLEAVSSDG